MNTTTLKDKTYNIRRPLVRITQSGMTIEDVAKAVCVTSYIESMLEDFDRLIDMKIDGSVKKRVRTLLREHDKSSSTYLSKPLCLQMSNILTKEMDRHRDSVKKNVNKKELDDKHFVLFLTYEIRAVFNVLMTLDYKSTLSYSNSIKGLINACNKWLCKDDFMDKMGIHTRRDKNFNALNGFIGEALVIFKEAEAEVQKKLNEKQS